MAATLALAGCGGDGDGASKPKAKPAPKPAPGPTLGVAGRKLEAEVKANPALKPMICEALEGGNDYFDIRSHHLTESAFVEKYTAKYGSAQVTATTAYSLLVPLEEREMDKVSLDLDCLASISGQ